MTECPVTRGSPPHAGKGHRRRGPRGDRRGLTPARGEGRASRRRRADRRGLTPARGEGTHPAGSYPPSSPAHPRTRRRGAAFWRPSVLVTGSPPHAGKGLRPRDRRDADAGLTPARGEGTAGAPSRPGVPRAHPRTRGRDDCMARSARIHEGSPPHAGKGQARAGDLLVDRRLTPARGEGTRGRCSRPRSRWAHPRTRGRDRTAALIPTAHRGSPPHAGKRQADGQRRRGPRGLTPARGEGTVVIARLRTWLRAHPRTRGRDVTRWVSSDRVWGSPPHAGKGLPDRLEDAGADGLTPARGEGTWPTRSSGCGSRAHPRTRGRDWTARTPGMHPRGSPPHAGKGQLRDVRHPLARGLTPARGEGTCRRTSRSSGPAAHPRTRGRDADLTAGSRGSPGSPPHAGKGPTRQPPG